MTDNQIQCFYEIKQCFLNRIMFTFFLIGTCLYMEADWPHNGPLLCHSIAANRQEGHSVVQHVPLCLCSLLARKYN